VRSKAEPLNEWFAYRRSARNVGFLGLLEFPWLTLSNRKIEVATDHNFTVRWNNTFDM
jgi:hypothetical protein